MPSSVGRSGSAAARELEDDPQLGEVEHGLVEDGDAALAGAPASRIARELRAQAKQAFGQLERGLGEYGI